MAPQLRLVDDELVRELVKAHHQFIWRLLARLGVPPADVDDATQQVFMVLTQREALQLQCGRERAFLFGVALKVAKTHKRTLARRREVGTDPLPDAADDLPSIEALTDQRRARVLLDQLLEEMPFDLRVVFVLFELEGAQIGEVVHLLDLPQGTIASRLRRGRDWFARRVKQLQARETFSRSTP